MFIGIDIGGSKVRVASSRTGHKIDHSVRFATPANQRRVLPLIIKAVENILGKSDIDAIGVASPGPIDKARGKILSPINLTWHNLEICKSLKKHFRCPTILEHDATCGGIAESRLGAGKKYHAVLYVTVSTGIGTSLVIDGKPIKSRHNLEGGKIVIDPSYLHTEGILGTFENVVSGQAIKRRYGKIAAEISSPEDWSIIAHDLAIGLFNLIATTSPDVVILAGGVAVHYKKFIKPLERELSQLKPIYQYPIPKILKATNVETAPVLGAIMLASDQA